MEVLMFTPLAKERWTRTGLAGSMLTPEVISATQ